MNDKMLIEMFIILSLIIDSMINQLQIQAQSILGQF